jgi:hypothetical protein
MRNHRRGALQRTARGGRSGGMPLPHPIQIETDDGFTTEIAELPDQSLRVTVSRDGRSWAGERASIDDAVTLGVRMRAEVGAGSADYITPETASPA